MTLRNWKEAVTMSAANLISKLVEIEKVVGKARIAEVHGLVLEAQSCVLEIQRQVIDTLRENARLRERMERYEPTSPAWAREFRLPSNAEMARELAMMPKAPAEEMMAPFLQTAS
jgi:hypothetical protein